MVFLAGLGADYGPPYEPDPQPQMAIAKLAIDDARPEAAEIFASMARLPAVQRQAFLKRAVQQHGGGLQAVEKRTVALVHYGFPVQASFIQALSELISGVGRLPNSLGAFGADEIPPPGVDLPDVPDDPSDAVSKAETGAVLVGVGFGAVLIWLLTRK